MNTSIASFRQEPPTRTALSLRTAIRRSLGFVGSVTLLGAGLFVAPHVFAQSAEGSSRSQTLEEVVVTARNRIESAQDVPLPIAVLSADRLEREEIKNIYDLPLVLPNFVITGNNARNISPRLRGLGGNGTGDSMERSVGFIVDGVTLYYTGQAWSEYVDLDRMEVLRGPQGTLMGKNTTLGAVNIVTKIPSFQKSSSLEIGVGDLNTLNGKFTSTGPLVDDLLAYRGSFSISRADGLYKNLYQSLGNASETWRETNKISGRVQLLWTPSENLTGRFIFDKLRSDERVNTGTVFVSNGPTTYADGTARPTFTPISYTPTGSYVNYGFLGKWAERAAWFHNPDGSVYQPLLGTTDIVNKIARPQITNQYGGSAQFDWKLGTHTLTSISSYRYQDFDIKNGGQNGIYDITNSGQQLWNNQVSQELRLTSSVGNKLDYQAGLYYLQARVYSDDPNYFGEDAGAYQATSAQYTTLIGTAAGRVLLQKSLEDVYQSSVTDARVSSIAAYGQADWHLSERGTLTLGVRQTQEHKTNRIRQELDRPGDNLDTLGATLGATAAQINAAKAVRTGQLTPAFDWYNGKSINQPLTAWNTGLNFKVTPDISVYGSVGLGVKSGFISFLQQRVPGQADLETTIRPEKSLDFELGVKSLLLGDTLQINLNIYQTNLKDYQASWTRQSDLNDANTRITGFGNAEKVIARGIELDSAYRIGDFTLSLNGAYNEATYETQWLIQRPNIASTQFFDAKGEQIANVPKWGFNQNLSYEIPFGRFLGTATFSNSYRSSAYLNDNHAAETFQKAYTVSNLGFGFGAEDKSWELSLFVKNVFDVDYSSTLGTWTNTSAVQQTIGQPRYATLVFRSRIK